MKYHFRLFPGADDLPGRSGLLPVWRFAGFLAGLAAAFAVTGGVMLIVPK